MVSECLDRAAVVPAPRQVDSTSLGCSSKAAAPQPSTSPTVLSWETRDQIADQIGGFIARSVAGGHRGLSGRERNPLPSRLFVVVRDLRWPDLFASEGVPHLDLYQGLGQEGPRRGGQYLRWLPV